MDLKSIAIVGLGSAIGGSLRYISTILIDRRWEGDFPLSIFLVNAIGSFLIGFLGPVFLKYGWSNGSPMPLLLSVGVMGGFTTFSTFSLQTLKLLQAGDWGIASLNAVASVLCCVLACGLGLKLGQTILGA